MLLPTPIQRSSFQSQKSTVQAQGGPSLPAETAPVFLTTCREARHTTPSPFGAMPGDLESRWSSATTVPGPARTRDHPQRADASPRLINISDIRTSDHSEVAIEQGGTRRSCPGKPLGARIGMYTPPLEGDTNAPSNDGFRLIPKPSMIATRFWPAAARAGDHRARQNL
jgi:hypothetical protein